jgi:hypothetical protein
MKGGLIDGGVGEGVGQVELGLLGGLHVNFKLDKSIYSLILLMIILFIFWWKRYKKL